MGEGVTGFSREMGCQLNDDYLPLQCLGRQLTRLPKKNPRHNGRVNSVTKHPDKRKNDSLEPRLGDSFLSWIGCRCLDVPPQQEADDPDNGLNNYCKAKVERKRTPDQQIDRDGAGGFKELGEGVDHEFEAGGQTAQS